MYVCVLIGLDYVSHEDILPYIPSEPKPINHELFDRFFLLSYGKGICVDLDLIVVIQSKYSLVSSSILKCINSKSDLHGVHLLPLFLAFIFQSTQLHSSLHYYSPLLALFISLTGYVAQDTLRLWHEKNHRWLELSDVHRETTEDIRVTATPFYMGERVHIFLHLF